MPPTPSRQTLNRSPAETVVGEIYMWARHYLGLLPLLDQQEMHCGISQDDESPAKDGEADDVTPQRERVEAKGAEDGGTGHFNVQTVSVHVM